MILQQSCVHMDMNIKHAVNHAHKHAEILEMNLINGVNQHIALKDASAQMAMLKPVSLLKPYISKN